MKSKFKVLPRSKAVEAAERLSKSFKLSSGALSAPLPFRGEDVIGLPIDFSNSGNQIVFTKDKELTRTISGKVFKYTFTGKKKRLSVFEILNDSSVYIPVDKLRELVSSPTQPALRKVIESLNRDIRLRLKINNNLIIGRRGFGYKINKDIFLVSE